MSKIVDEIKQEGINIGKKEGALRIMKETSIALFKEGWTLEKIAALYPTFGEENIRIAQQEALQSL